MKRKFKKLEKCHLGTVSEEEQLYWNESWYLSTMPFPEFSVANVGVCNPDLTDKSWTGGVWSKEISFVRLLVIGITECQK